MLYGFVAGISICANAQQRDYISLSDAVEMAAQSNLNIQMVELEHKVAKANYHQTDAIFLPQLSVSYTAMSTNNPLNAFGFLLQQRSVTVQDFDPATLNNPGSVQNYGAAAEIKLPLLNLDMLYARKGAKLQKEIYTYKIQYTKDYISFEVKRAYTQLQFAYQAQSILMTTLRDVEQVYESVKNFYDQGLVQKSDLLNAQLQVNTVASALTKAESSIANASEGLRILLGGLSEDENLLLTDSLSQYSHPIASQSFSIIRADVMAMQKGVESSEMMVKSSAMNYLPKINAFGSYQLNDSKAFGFTHDSYVAGVNLSWTIYSGNQNRSKLKSSIYQRDKMKSELSLYIDKNRAELNKNQRDIADLESDIKRQQTGVEQASESYRITNDRYNEGLVSTTDLLMSQAQLSQQRLSLAQKIMSYNIARYYMELLTSIN